MLVMQPTNIPFQEMADQIARDFLTKGASLEDSIVDAAKKRDLKPEEVKRLVEKSNTAASILYLKNSEDKKGSFDLAKKEDVLKRTHPEVDEDALELEDNEDNLKDDTEDAEEAAEAERTGLPENRKVASFREPEQRHLKKEAARHDDITVHDIFAARDRLEELKQIKIAAEMKIQDILHGIINDYQYKSDEELSKLAADASDMYGNGAKALLETAAAYMKKDISMDKFASDVIDDCTKPMQMLKEASALLNALPKMDEAIVELRFVLNRVHG